MKRNATRSGSIAMLLAVIGATAASAAQSAWVSDSGNVEIRLQDRTWLLNNAGPATIRPGTAAADFEVYYQDGNGTRCGYRQRIIENGAAIILEPTDSTQSSDLCPSGKFNRVGIPVQRMPPPQPRY